MVLMVLILHFSVTSPRPPSTPVHTVRYIYSMVSLMISLINFRNLLHTIHMALYLITHLFHNKVIDRNFCAHALNQIFLWRVESVSFGISDVRSPLKANLAAAEIRTPCGAAAWATGPSPDTGHPCFSDKCRQISMIHDETLSQLFATLYLTYFLSDAVGNLHIYSGEGAPVVWSGSSSLARPVLVVTWLTSR